MAHGNINSGALAALSCYDDEQPSPDAQRNPDSPQRTSAAQITGQPQLVGTVPLPPPSPHDDGVASCGAIRTRLPDGRVRSFPHVDGNYAGFVFVSVGRAHGLGEASCEAIAAATSVLANGDQLQTILGDDRHLSVSRTFALRRHQIEPLVQDLKARLKTIPSFEIEMCGWDVLSNDDATRSFVVIPLRSGLEKLRSIVRAVDRTLARWRIEPYYEQQRFHVSVAWFAGVPQPNKLLQGPKETTTATWMVKTVHAKIGARSYNFPLRGC